MVAVMGPSGSGKSTLLTIAGSLEDPTSGEVLVGGAALSGMSRNDKARLRRRTVGYVFQDFNLLPGLTAAENVALPLELDGMAGGQGPRGRAARAGRAGPGRAGQPGSPTSCPAASGSGWRSPAPWWGSAACCWPTSRPARWTRLNGEEVMRLIHEACKRGVAAVVVTHDAQLASWADRVVFLRDGRVDGPDRAAARPRVAAQAAPGATPRNPRLPGQGQ